MENTSLDKWIEDPNGLLAQDPINIRNLTLLKINGEEIGFEKNLEKCMLHLIKLEWKPITTYNKKAKWVDTFFEIGENTTLYDEVMQQVYCSGDDITKYFWMGNRLPTNIEISTIDELF